jgi:transcriptional regulator with XRE-family HTH domain
MTAGELLQTTRARHDLSQSALARRASTTPRQIARIERGEISPSVSTLARLLAVMGEQLELTAVPAAHGNQTLSELHHAMATPPATRLQQAASLSRTATTLASRAR